MNKYLKKKIPQKVYGEAYDLLAELCARGEIPARFVEWDGLEKLLDAFIGYGVKYGKSAKVCDFLSSPNTITKRICTLFRKPQDVLAPILQEAE